jgi:putative membrane protein
MNIERNRTAWIGLGVVLLFGLAALSAMGAGMFGWHPGMDGYASRPFMGMGPGFGFGLIGVLVRVAIWGGLIMLGLSFFRRRGAWRGYHSEQSSLEILKRRYAAGEISREQFDEMRRVLDPSVTTS